MPRVPDGFEKFKDQRDTARAIAGGMTARPCDSGPDRRAGQ